MRTQDLKPGWARFAVLILWSGFVMNACGGSTEPAAAPSQDSEQPASSLETESFLNCGAEIRGLRDLLREGAVVLFGELHGTREAPAFVGTAACLAAEMGLPVRVGVEVSSSLQPAVDRFLWSGGTVDDVKELLKGPFWKGRDGRASEGLLALLDQMRELRLLGLDLDVYLFDIPVMEVGVRDVSMAHNILIAHEKAPEAVHLILTGNMHARTKSEQWMGWHIRQRLAHLISLDISYAGGNAWLSTGEGIGVTQLGGKDRGPLPFVELDVEAERDDYDGRFYVGPVSASLPATLGSEE